MAPNRKIRQKTTLKTTLRLSILAVAASITGLVVLLIVVFNLSKEEQGYAAQSMVFRSCTTVQDTMNVLRGSINQNIIGVVVDVTGNGNPTKVNSIVFTANGTSQPVEQNIENARLWYTGTDDGFMPISQTGSTVLTVSNKPFEIVCNQTLKAGKNYFWLTFDVKSEAAFAPGNIDATCSEIRIGAISYKPLISNPAGKRFTEPNIPYYSMGNFPANNMNGWNSKRDGSGIAPKQLNAARNSFFIQAGHRIISSTGASLQTVVVEKGGELKITSPLRLNTLNVAFGGIVEQDVTVTDYYCFNNFIMENGSNYIHNNTGYFPGLNNILKTHSNQTFFQYGEATFSYHTSWGNVIIDATTPLDIDVQKNFSNVKGDFELKKTGSVDQKITSSNGIFCGGNDTLWIGGSLIISGGNFYGLKSNSQEQLVVNIGKDLMVRDGNLYDVFNSNKGKSIFNVNGNVVLTGGNVQFSRGCGSEMAFIGNGESKWYQKNTATVMLGSVVVGSKHTLVLKGDKLGDISSRSLMDIQEGGKLLCGNNIVTGLGDFILQDNATIGIGKQDGLSSSGEKGNIQTKGRIFHSGANYMYYTACNSQQTGDFTTRPISNTMRNLIINKDAQSQKVILSQDFSILEQVMINKGDVVENGKELKLPKMSDSN